VTKDMATVVREIERKYDLAEAGPAALDAVAAMTGGASCSLPLCAIARLEDAHAFA